MDADRKDLEKAIAMLEGRKQYHEERMISLRAHIELMKDMLNTEFPKEERSDDLKLSEEVRKFFISQNRDLSVDEILSYLEKIEFKFNPRMNKNHSVSISLAKSNLFEKNSKDSGVYKLAEWEDIPLDDKEFQDPHLGQDPLLDFE